MSFWIIAIAILIVSAAVIGWPLLSGSSKERFLGIGILLLLPLAGLLLYQQTGTPAAINTAQSEAATHGAEAPQIDELLAQLQQSLAEDPNNPEGWLILGRSLKSMQRYPEALDAIERANELLPGSPAIMVELAEAKLFASGNPVMGPDIRQLLESAVSLDPQQQKGLWLLGMAAAQRGDFQDAIEYWTSLQAMMDPASNAAMTVVQQIANAKNQLAGGAGADGPTQQSVSAATSSPANTQTSPAIAITIDLGEDLPPPPASAVLFVFVHPSGERGMPLAVQRIQAPAFPMSINLSDADTLRPGTSLSDHAELDISARVSLSGVANSASGDYQANVATVESDTETTIALNLDQRVP